MRNVPFISPDSVWSTPSSTRMSLFPINPTWEQVVGLVRRGVATRRRLLFIGLSEASKAFGRGSKWYSKTFGRQAVSVHLVAVYQFVLKETHARPLTTQRTKTKFVFGNWIGWRQRNCYVGYIISYLEDLFIELFISRDGNWIWQVPFGMKHCKCRNDINLAIYFCASSFSTL